MFRFTTLWKMINTYPSSCRWGYIGFTPSVHPSVPPSHIPCPLCSAYSSDWIHFIFIYVIKLLQKVCRMQGFLQNFKLWIFSNFLKFVSLTLSVLTWDVMWIASMGNHGAVGGISERRLSSCSSYDGSVSYWISIHINSLWTSDTIQRHRWGYLRTQAF